MIPAILLRTFAQRDECARGAAGTLADNYGMHRPRAADYRHMFRRLSLAAALLLMTPAVASASHHRRRPLPRVGGHVRPAWPHSGRPPRSRLARWLAQQVGAAEVTRCRRHCAARIASAPAAGTATTGLALARSYQIPADDPAYRSLVNWSWTYDSAISATGFVATGNRAEAQQLLDQLAALQHTDGSIEQAFNVATGQPEALFRSGTIAWVGLAGAIFDDAYGSTRYLTMEELASNYLLSLIGTGGLVRGGPDVSWSSTQHNLIAYALLARLGAELDHGGDPADAARYVSAAEQLANAIESNLIVINGSTAYLTEGFADTTQALDTQTLGAMFLASRGQATLAKAVLAYAESAFALPGQSIALSNSPAAYNMTYSSPGPFAGVMPYLGTGAPQVLWPEGTAEIRLAAADVGAPVSTLDTELNAFAGVTAANAGALLQANATVTAPAYGVQYHVWPSAAPTAWLMTAQASSTVHLFPQLPSYVAGVLASAPSLYYRLDDASGTTALDSSAGGHNGTYVGGVTLGAKGATPDGDTAATFDGSSGYVANSARFTNPQVFTLEAWFHTTTDGGAILGFADAPTGTPANDDRVIYMNNAGQLYFGVGANRTIHTTAKYDDGSWHLVDATLGPDGMALYADGVLAASDPKTTSAQAYDGYWRVGGMDSLSSWSSKPHSSYFAGAIDEAAVYPSELTATQIAAHFSAAG